MPGRWSRCRSTSSAWFPISICSGRATWPRIKRTLASAGIDANIIFTEFAGLENLRRIPAAALNVVLSPWNGHRVAEKLEATFGTPFITFPGVPVGPKQTTALLQSIAQQIPGAADALRAVISEQERHAYRFAEYFAEPLVSGFPVLQFVVVADSGTAIGLTQYLTNETLFIPEAVIVSDDPPEELRAQIVRELSDGVDGPFKARGDLRDRRSSHPAGAAGPRLSALARQFAREVHRAR